MRLREGGQTGVRVREETDDGNQQGGRMSTSHWKFQQMHTVGEAGLAGCDA